MTIQPHHIYTFVVKESYLDYFGHVNHAYYLTLFEEARWDFVNQIGFGLEKMLRSEVGFVVLEVQIRFLKELRLRQKIMIETRFESFESKIAQAHQTMKDEAGQVCCTAALKYGFFDMKQRKLIAPAPEWIEAIRNAMPRA